MTDDRPGVDHAGDDEVISADRLGQISHAQRLAQYSDVDHARVNLAAATRRILEEQSTTVADAEAIERARALVEQAAIILAGRDHGREYQGTAEGSLADSGQWARLDFSPFVGAMSPIAPPMALEWEGDTVVGRATYGQVYEGPPGCLHGGFIAAGFDEVLGFAQALSGNPGMTGRLTIHYRSPTPLQREVVFRGRYVRTEGRKVFTEATLHDGDRLCAEAEGLFISMKREVFERLAAERGARLP